MRPTAKGFCQFKFSKIESPRWKQGARSRERGVPNHSLRASATTSFACQAAEETPHTQVDRRWCTGVYSKPARCFQRLFLAGQFFTTECAEVTEKEAVSGKFCENQEDTPIRADYQFFSHFTRVEAAEGAMLLYWNRQTISIKLACRMDQVDNRERHLRQRC